MAITITGQMNISTLQERFNEEFGLTLRGYDGRSFADPSNLNSSDKRITQ